MHGKEYIFLVPWLFGKFFSNANCGRRSGSSAVGVYAEKEENFYFFFFHFFAEPSSWGMLLRSTRKAAMAGSEKKIPTVSVIYQPAKTGGTGHSVLNWS